MDWTVADRSVYHQGVTVAPAVSARQRILDVAYRLFYARGIRAVGVDLLVAESGVAKATFYKHFPTKDALVLAYLDRVDDDWTGQLHSAAAAAGDAPADQLVGLFDALTTACGRDGYRGCGFINAAAETQPGTPAHDRIVAHKQAVLAWITELATRAGVRSPGELARALTLLLDGGLATGALDADPAAAHQAAQTARLLVARHTGSHPMSSLAGRGRPATVC